MVKICTFHWSKTIEITQCWVYWQYCGTGNLCEEYKCILRECLALCVVWRRAGLAGNVEFLLIRREVYELFISGERDP